MKALYVFGIVGLLAAANPPQASGTDLEINELRIDQGGSDVDEYFELKGTPSASLDGLTYIVIGDSGGGLSGVIEAVVDLTGSAIGASGFFVAAEDPDVPGGGLVELITTLNFENSDNVTHMLVSGFTGAIGVDLDPKILTIQLNGCDSAGSRTAKRRNDFFSNASQGVN